MSGHVLNLCRLLVTMTLVLLGQPLHASDARPSPLRATCTAADIDAQFKRFDDDRQRSKHPINCPSHHWLRLFAEHSSLGHKVFFDIGCNKGYEVAKLLQLWAPQLNVTPKGICNHQGKLQGKQGCEEVPLICGSCMDCQDPVATASPLDHDKFLTTSLAIHCYEASSTSISRLVTIRDSMVPLNGTHNMSWQIHPLALGDRVGSVQFPKDCSTELCSIHNAGGDTVDVPLTSIDAEMDRLRLPYVDLVKIDTEGNDPNVIAGATKALREHRIGMLHFEYHFAGLWANVTLQHTVLKLSKFGMVCYMIYGDQYFRLTGCWHPGFEFKDWSNVFCIHFSHFLYQTIDRVAMYRQVI